MDFSKYDPLKQKTQSNAGIESEKRMGIPTNRTDRPNLEAGFTAADYNDHSSAPGRSEPWMSSTPVILLIEYLRKYPDRGTILYERFGTVGLKFKPGIKGDDIKNGRAQIALNMIRLLQDASCDLKDMISRGIEIPLLVHDQPKAKVQ